MNPTEVSFRYKYGETDAKLRTVTAYASKKLFVSKLHFLNVDSFFKLIASCYRFFNESLSVSQFSYDACFLEFTFEFL